MKIHKIKLQSGQTIWIKEKSKGQDDFDILLQDPDGKVLTEELADGTIVDVWGDDLYIIFVGRKNND